MSGEPENRLYQSLVDALPQAILVVDGGLKVVMGNPSLSRLLLKSGEEIKDQELSALIPHNELPDWIREVQQLGEAKEVELHLGVKRDVRPRILKVIIVPLKVILPAPFSLLVLEDISEKMMLEEQLVQSEKLAGMGHLASTLAHELGNPLGIMNSTLQYIQSSLARKGDHALREAVETIIDNVDRMGQLLRGLSGLTDMPPPRFDYVDLRHVLSQVLAFISKEAEKRHIRVHTDFATELPNCWVDVRRMKQVFLNLFKNALEAMPTGGTLSVRAQLVSESRGGISIEFVDTGVGIAETELRSVFRPLYSTKPGGSGLGLSFCRQVVEEHGGEIHIKSWPGKGTTVTVSLPLDQERERNELPADGSGHR